MSIKFVLVLLNNKDQFDEYYQEKRCTKCKRMGAFSGMYDPPP